MRDAYGSPSCFYSPLAAAAADFIDEEARDFNPYRVQATAPVLMQEAVTLFGIEACDGLEFWIH